MQKEETNALGTENESKQADRLLCLALDVGEGMLKSGGEVRRVEDTIARICQAYGAEHTEIFAIPSLIIAAVRLKNGAYSSQVRRVEEVANDLSRLEALNAVSRSICKEVPPPEEAERRVLSAKRERTYPTWLRVFAAAIAAGAFSVFFGGDVRDGAVAAGIGAGMFLLEVPSLHQINRLARTVLQALVGGLLTCLAVRLGIGHHLGAMMIGTIMVLIPGLAFGTAFRDLLCGDLLAGSLKVVQCLLTALMIAAGYLLAMFLMGGVV